MVAPRTSGVSSTEASTTNAFGRDSGPAPVSLRDLEQRMAFHEIDPSYRRPNLRREVQTSLCSERSPTVNAPFGQRQFVAIHGRLDAETHQALRKLREAVDLPGVRKQHAAHSHITFAVCPGIAFPCTEDVVLQSRLSAQLKVHFTHIGTFVNPVGVIFLGVAVSRPLLDIHEDVQTMLARHEIPASAWYQPGKWTPHCTIAMPIPTGNLADALDAVSKVELPTHGWLQSLHLTTVAPTTTRHEPQTASQRAESSGLLLDLRFTSPQYGPPLRPSSESPP